MSKPAPVFIGVHQDFKHVVEGAPIRLTLRPERSRTCLGPRSIPPSTRLSGFGARWGGGRQAGRTRARERSNQGFLEATGGNALEMEPRRQTLDEPGLAQVGRKDRRGEPHLLDLSTSIPHLRHLHGDRAAAIYTYPAIPGPDPVVSTNGRLGCRRSGEEHRSELRARGQARRPGERVASRRRVRLLGPDRAAGSEGQASADAADATCVLASIAAANPKAAAGIFRSIRFGQYLQEIDRGNRLSSDASRLRLPVEQRFPNRT